MSAARESLALPAGAAVGPYRVRQWQSAWGFYLVYAGVDPRSSEAVLIQELVPEEWCVRGADGVLAGRDAAAQEKLAGACGRYSTEGRALAALAVPGVRKIREVVEANGTVCWITPPDEARTCKSWLGVLGRAPTEAELRRLLDALLAALAPVHAAGLGHFNLKPGTIQLTPGGRPVLTRFANARQAIARCMHDAGAATDGYSPPEQYDPDRSEDARTDIYALAAVCYRAIAGQPPPAAPQRIADDTLGRLAERFADRYSRRLLVALDAALALDPAARPRTLAAWRQMLGPSVAQQRTRVAAVVAAAVALAVGLWIAFKPDPKPNDTQVQDSTSEKKAQEQTSEEKKTEEQKQAEEQKMAEEKKQAEEAQKTAEEKRLAAEKAEEERRAKEEAMKQAKTAEEKAAATAALNKAAEEAAAKKLAAEIAARKAVEEKKAADEAAARAAAEMAARKAAEEKKAADEAAARAAAEMAVRKAAEEKKAADEAAARVAAEMAARKAAEEKKAADEAAARASAEMAARKVAEEKKAAEQAAAKKRVEEMAAQARATPVPTPPPPAPSSGFFSSLPIDGEWTPAAATPDPARRLVIRAQVYTLSGADAATGVAKLNGAIIYVTPKSTDRTEEGVCKMRALDRIVIEGTSLAGEWRRVLKPVATPPP